MSENVQKMPYNADMKILEKILLELRTTREEGMDVNQMWVHIQEADNPHKSYTLNMAKFLHLVETEGDTIKLTYEGRLVMLAPENKRREKLAEKLPDKYMAMYKWIKFATDQQMSSREIKEMYFKNFKEVLSKIVFERMIATFAKYLEYLGLVKIKGRGQGTKITLTDFGNRILDQPIHSPAGTEKQGSVGPQSYSEPRGEVDKDLTEHPITILSPGRNPFSHDIRSEADWVVIDSFIASIKEDYKAKANSRKRSN